MTTLVTQHDIDNPYDLGPDWQNDNTPHETAGGDPLTSVCFDVHRHQRSIELLEAAASEYCDEIYTLKSQCHDLAESVRELQLRQLDDDVVDATF